MKQPSDRPRGGGKHRLYRLAAAKAPHLAPWLHLLLLALSLLALDLGLRWFCRFAMTVGKRNVLKLLPFTLGWTLLLTGIAALLPRRLRQVYMTAVGLVYSLLAVVHGVYINMFRKFFSFSDIAFAGDGAAFLDSSYLVIRKLLLAWILLCFALTVLAVLLVPPELEKRRPRNAAAAAAGLALLLLTRYAILGKSSDVIIWDQNQDAAFLYEDFSDSRACLPMLGLYQYTFRDLTKALNIGGTHISDAEAAEVAAWQAEKSHGDNDMSGLFAGKNLLLIQLEAIDTWMLTEDYMPNLWALKEQSIDFTQHYTPAYITAGTFNTEFMVNSGLLPAESGVPATVYTQNAFPNSLANLFRGAGYTAQSFHGSEGDVYNREAVHENLGYEQYWSGSGMGMENYTMDRYLMSGYEEMTGQEPFFSFVITYSGHGPYGPENPIGQAHQAEADAVALRSEEVYRYAVAHAMETDLFIGELVEQLTADGHMEDTVLIFYADHYNYYLMNDALNQEIKGVDSLNELTHTNWFIYDGGQHTAQVGKVTSSLDVAPTIANLFGLEADYAAYLGSDAFGPDGGLVFFSDNSWYDGAEWSAVQREDVLATRRVGKLMLLGDWFGQ
ncbi:MAG: LTA synthase family protein [Oscillospiraceae bacterium]